MIQLDTNAEAATSFADFNLDSTLNRAIDAIGFESPTPVQCATIPLGLQGRDIIGTAQTGTGKTAAFVLPILQHLIENPSTKLRTRVLVLTPTRELAEQIADCFRTLSRFTTIRTATVYGGVSMGPQQRALASGVEIIVACPGRLLDHMDRGNAKLANVEKLVIDEADRMLDMGFLPSIRRILSKLPATRHTALFSATFAPELQQLAKDNMNEPLKVAVDICAPAKTVEHALYPCAQHLKSQLLLRLIGDTDTNSILIFTRTKRRADVVARVVERAGYTAAVLHSNKSQNQRQIALERFKSGKCQILVATDIAARGLDVETISHVVNYDIPDTTDAYIHRIGRTGRAEREGWAMTLVTGQDAAIVWDIERVMGAPIERKHVEDFDYNARPTPAQEKAAASRPAPPQVKQRMARAQASPVAAAARPQRPQKNRKPKQFKRAATCNA